MKVATIICNHNYGEYVGEAIKSALNQTYPTTIFVFDDASTDNSLSEIEPFSDKIAFAQSTVQIGPSEARNILIDLAIQNGFDVMAILDADDMMYRSKIEKCLRPLADPAVGVVYADYDIWDLNTDNIIREHKEPFDRYRLRQECIIHSGSLIKKEALLAVKNQNGFYNRTMRTCEDYELWVRISKQYMISHVPEALTLVRNHIRNSTNTVDKSIWESNWRKVAEAYA